MTTELEAFDVLTGRLDSMSFHRNPGREEFSWTVSGYQRTTRPAGVLVDRHLASARVRAHGDHNALHLSCYGPTREAALLALADLLAEVDDLTPADPELAAEG